MDLDRGALARVDRKLLAGLGQDETYRMVRVPVTPCGRHGSATASQPAFSMGRAIAAMIDRELVSVFNESAGDPSPVFAEQAEEELVRRQKQVARREEETTGVEERLRAWNEHLRRWEAELEVRERRVELAAKMAAQAREAEGKVG